MQAFAKGDPIVEIGGYTMRLFRDLDIERVHTWAFYLLCGIGLFSNISLTGVNNCFGALALVIILRLRLKHDDWREALPHGRLGTALLILIAAVTLSVVFSDNILKNLRMVGDYYVYRMLGLYAILLVIREKRRLMMIAMCVAISFVIDDLFVIYQGLFQGNYRAPGFSLYMSVGGFLSMLLPALVLLLLSGKLDARHRVWGMIVLVIGCMALLYNGTRGAWLAVPMTVLLCGGFLIRQKKKFFIGTVLSCVIFIGVFSVSPILSSRLASISDMNLQSNSERILLWRSAYHMFEDHPLLGVGFRHFEAEYQGRYILPEAKEPNLGHAHSNIMHMLAECGAVGLLALLFFWGTWIFYSIHTWKRMHHIAALLFLSVLTGLILQGLTEYNMGNSAVMKLHWLLLGLSLQWLRLDGVKLG